MGYILCNMTQNIIVLWSRKTEKRGYSGKW